MSLLESLSDRPGEQPLLFHLERWHTVEEVRKTALAIRTQAKDAKSKRVMLVSNTPGETLLTMLALDGFASHLLLAGSTIDECTMHDLVLRAQIEKVFASGHPEWETFQSQGDTVSQLTGDESSETKWIIPTSGTTGAPKLVEHSLAAMSSSVRRDINRGGDFVWGLMYDVTRFAGIQVILQAIIGGSSIAIPESMDDMETVGRNFYDAGVNAISATPSMWRKMVMAGILDRLNLEILTLGGEPADDRILTELRTRFPASRITHIYASTEAGVGFSVTDGKAGFPSSFIDRELPGGVKIRVDSDMRLILSKKTQYGRYIGPDNLYDKEGWINSGDLVEMKGDRYYFRGRENGTINVGGQKLQPSEVEEIILAIPGVAMALVRARPNPVMGSLVEALVVPTKQEHMGSLKEEILRECRSRLPAFKVPAIIKFTDEIPLTQAGKIKRI